MIRSLFVLAGLFAAMSALAQMPSTHYGLPAPESRYTLKAQGVDRAAALAEDISKPKSERVRYALRRDVNAIRADSAGEWRDLGDGNSIWRLPIRADNAVSLDFGFRDFFLPPGAQLFVGNETQQLRAFDDSDNPRNGKFWTPLVAGDHAQIEVLLPTSMKRFLRLDLAAVNVGYRHIFQQKSLADPTQGSGSCNVDTICPEGDAWRSQIAAEAVVVISSGFCSGQLLNDTNNDRAPLLSTANHCITTQDDADSLIVYWKYESPTCRAVGSSENGDPVPTTSAIAQTGGSLLLATYQPADFTLVRLNTTPPAAANAFWNGWDRTETLFGDAAVMHHPNADAKRISFPAGTVTLDDGDHGQDFVPGLHHWHVDHYQLGTTEEGSSGSGLMDANRHLRGVLSGGAALCSVPDGDDYYGRISTAWSGGGTPATRVSDWLDPTGSQPFALDGIGSCAAPTVTLASSAAVATAGQHITFTASASGGKPPYAYSFDLDGDGVQDNNDTTSPTVTAAYPAAYSGNAVVNVTDSAGCVGTTSRAQIVQAQDVHLTSAATSVTPSCGGASIEPGGRYTAHLSFANSGAASTSNAYAIFAANTSDPSATSLTLETPAVALPALAPQAQTSVDVTFDVPSTASCDASVSIDYLGTADDNGFTPDNAAVVRQFVAQTCQPLTCTASPTSFAYHQGNYFDALRSGNGITSVVTPVSGSDPLFFGAWFTGDLQRDPTWFAFSDLIHANQVNTTLYQLQQSAPGVFPTNKVAVGTAQATYIAANKFAFTWTMNGKSGGGMFVPVVNDPNSSMRAWFNTNEGGWGTFDELFPSAGTNGRPFMFSVAYIYDASGMPRWTAASDGSYSEGDVMNVQASRPTCPGCVWVDYGSAGVQTVGTQQYKFAGDIETLTTTIVLPSSYAGSWNRNNLQLSSLIVP